MEIYTFLNTFEYNRRIAIFGHVIFVDRMENYAIKEWLPNLHNFLSRILSSIETLRIMIRDFL